MSEALPPAGFLIGHHTDEAGATGCTVIVAPPGSRGGVDDTGFQSALTHGVTEAQGSESELW